MSDDLRRTLASKLELGAERCGLLFGAGTRRDVRVTLVVELPNHAARPDRFALDPAEMVRCMREWERRDRECLGTWHTHPGSAPTLSSHDVAGAAPGWISAIVGSRGELSAYRHELDGSVTELRIAPPRELPA